MKAPLRVAWVLAAGIALAAPGGAARAVVPDSLPAARSLVRQSRYLEAQALARRCLEREEKSAEDDPARLADALDVIAESMRRGGRGRDPEAREVCERALRLREGAARPDSAAIAGSLHNLASLLYVTGAYAEARPLLEQSLALRERVLGPDHPDVAMSLLYLGSLVSDMGDESGARALLERAVAIQERTLPADDPDRALGLQRLAGLLYKLGDWSAARPLYEESLAIRERALGPDDPQVAIGLHNLATLVAEQDEPLLARTLYERALAIRERHAEESPLLLASTLSNLGNLLHEAGEDERARPMLERALAIISDLRGPDHPEVAWTLRGLALMDESAGRLASADTLHARALAIREKGLGPNHPDVAQSLVDLARLRARSSPGWALDAALRAESIGRDHLLVTARTLAEREALRYAAVRATGLDVAMSIAAEGAPDARATARVWDAVIRSRALVLDEIASRSADALNDPDPGVAAAAEAFVAARGRLASLLVRGALGDAPSENPAEIAGARDAMEQAERALAERNESFRLARARSRIGLEEVAAALPQGSALVAYVRYYSLRAAGAPSAAGWTASYAAFILGAPGASPLPIPLGPAARIDSLVARWSAEASHGALDPGRTPRESEEACRAAGEALRSVLWDPISRLVRGADLLLVVPDGSCHLVSFAALPSEPGHYLIEEGPLFHYLSTERDVAPSSRDGAERRRPSRRRRTRLRCASRSRAGRYRHAPAAPHAALLRGFEGIRFDPLPDAAREAEEVFALWSRAEATRATAPAGGPAAKAKSSSCVVGARADEGTFKSRAPGRRVLHLATHGFFLTGTEAGRGSAVALRGVGGLSTGPPPEPPPGTGEEALQLSGLALAGANRRATAASGRDDGVLTSEEISTIDLSGVEWAVLSGCETGAGRDPGERGRARPAPRLSSRRRQHGHHEPVARRGRGRAGMDEGLVRGTLHPRAFDRRSHPGRLDRPPDGPSAWTTT